MNNCNSTQVRVLGRSAKLIPTGSTSIVIPCYNYAHFLAEAIESAIAQTTPAREIIVVNDGSTDETECIALQYPVTVITQTNQGVASARNTGIMHASGIYILPLDADDKIHPEYLEKTTVILDRRPENGVVFTNRQHFGLIDTIKKSPIFDLEQMKAKCMINYCSLLRRRLWSDCGGYDATLEGYEDWDFWLSAAERGWSFQLVSETLFFYRKHGYSLSDVARAKHESLMLKLRHKHRSIF